MEFPITSKSIHVWAVVPMDVICVEDKATFATNIVTSVMSLMQMSEEVNHTDHAVVSCLPFYLSQLLSSNYTYFC